MPLARWFLGLGVALIASVLLAAHSGEAAKKRIDWGAINPALQGATFVKDTDTCLTCHEDSTHSFLRTAHARAFRQGKMPEEGECETCHGPASKHVETPGPELKWTKLVPTAQAGVCMQCHEGGARMGWKSGPHQSAEVSCSSCHSVMAARSERALLVRARAPDTCYACHAEVRGQMSKSSHHPVREGRMDCSSCHNPHGSQPVLMRTATVNETCVSCHTEKRGPFVWEHPPVRENCTTCHAPHGANNRNLLARKDPFLCLQCHSYGGHINLPRYNRVSTPYGSGCVNCHITTHGSNHPSGAKQTR